MDQNPKVQANSVHTQPPAVPGKGQIAGEMGTAADSANGGEASVNTGSTLSNTPSPKVNGAFVSSFLLGSESGKIFLPEAKAAVPPLMLAVPPAIEMAEGYIELVTQPASKLGVARGMKRQFALKALNLATDAGECWHNAKHEARRQMVIGQSLRLLKRHRSAVAAFRKASKHRPSRVAALMAMAWCQKRLGQVTEAVVTLTRALAITPEDPRLHYNLACYLCVSGQARAALYELAWALELDSSLRTRALLDSDFDALRTAPAFFALTASRTTAK
jgi:tetratricopeptide (TPR) repeat protein